MGKQIEKNRIKFIIEDKDDCLMYLGHILEYAYKKHNVHWELFLESVRYYAHELDQAGCNFRGDIGIDQLIKIEDEKILNKDITFSKYKLFTSSMRFVEMEIRNLIGDFSIDKRSISYINYLDIIKKGKFKGVAYQHSPQRDKLVKEYNEIRNYDSHFTSDKLCEWIDFRIEQVKNFNAEFEFGKEFSIHICDKIPLENFRKELVRNLIFSFELKEIIEFMKHDFEHVLGVKINFNIIESHFDNSCVTISQKGIESHQKSSKRSQRYI